MGTPVGLASLCHALGLPRSTGHVVLCHPPTPHSTRAHPISSRTTTPSRAFLRARAGLRAGGPCPTLAVLRAHAPHKFFHPHPHTRLWVRDYVPLWGWGQQTQGVRAQSLHPRPQESGDENAQHPPCSPAPDHRPQGCMPGALGNQRTDMKSGDRRKGFTAPSLQVHSVACCVHGPVLREQQAGHGHPHPAAAPLHGHGPCSPLPSLAVSVPASLWPPITTPCHRLCRGDTLGLCPLPRQQGGSSHRVPSQMWGLTRPELLYPRGALGPRMRLSARP